MATKTKYQIRKVGARASYYTSKLAIAPVVAVVDTGTAALQATTAIVKTTTSALTHLVKAPFSGVARGHQIHKAKFGEKYANSVERNTKLANGDLVETVIPAEEIQ
jgi:hypothetical protein